MSKGSETKQNILEIGLALATRLGLESISIGILAKATGMSKSGLFAHFNSKENLQLAILEFAAADFTSSVIKPALETDSGIPRISHLVSNWIDWASKLTGGCIFVTSSVEFSDRPGKVRNLLLHQQQAWLNCLQRVGESAVKTKHFCKNANLDQFAFDTYSLLLGVHYFTQLLQDTETLKYQQSALEKLLLQYSTPEIDIKKYL